jgi:S1/P1 Nuclease
MRGWILAAGVLLGALTSPPAGAWGAEGHRIIADVAESLLDARSRAAIRELAGGESLANIATWMDEERPRLQRELPGSSAWHYDDIPVCAPADGHSCPNGHCASRALATYRGVLADRHASPAERLLALRIVVHLVGDIHQPLHMADNDDRGGNAVRILGSRASVERGPESESGAPGRPTRNLHAVWDVDFVRRTARHASPAELASRLIAEHRADRSRIEAGTPADWMAESHAIARDFAYGQLPGFACGERGPRSVALPERYQVEATRIVRERLADAGIRLAVVLRAALD